ncbi:unnamed protein product [Phaedon cochleariae]|uniref:RING-type domain-containing protein n=1 Tax=Phaedon cochleariae TaxID=80249 RepID=A0A9P0DRP6_PHACE|nr:unnamed protein product [Phaedon cochleariae]
MSQERSKMLTRDLNSIITCRLCEGYLIDATALTECFHVFCRGCILRYFENSKTGCPTCNTVYKKKSQVYFRADPQTQSLVYKLVPSLYAREMQRREDFYRSTGLRASSSCSDDSVIDRERDMINDQEEMISKYVGDKALFLSPDDSVSLSLEYYQAHLDIDKQEKAPEVLKTPDNSEVVKNNANSTNSDNSQINSLEKNVEIICDKNNKTSDKEDNVKKEQKSKDCDKRFLRCPAAVSMKHLQKFIRMKFGLTGDHRVDIIYKGEVLPKDFSLMDVAYSFKWKREKPMRFFYRIFTPTKVRPIKIVNTISSGGEKQLQIVPIKSIPENQKSSKEEKIESVENVEKDKLIDETEDQKQNKERLFAHLQLQSKSQTEKETKKVSEKNNESVFDYEEPDEEEIKKFAEKRDREWALQKKLDESKTKGEGYIHVSKKRKKSKHSKNEFVHKKRKLHAEIASNEEDLKLKVKITNNGYKHKHHKSSGQCSEKSHSSDTSTKEKLLQMRQVRHKHTSNEDKIIQTVPIIKLSKDTTSTEKLKITVPNNDPVSEYKDPNEVPPKLPAYIKKLKIKVSEPSSKVTESAVMPKQQAITCSTSPKMGTFLEPSSSNSGFSLHYPIGKEMGKKIPTVQLERNEQTEKQAQKTFFKPFNASSDKPQRIEGKVQQNKIENKKIKQLSSLVTKAQIQITTENKETGNNTKNLERQIATLKQNCSIKASLPEKIDKQITINKDKLKTTTSHYPPGFTVSKVEHGVKRKLEHTENNQDKRPSLEITLISSPTNSPVQMIPKSSDKPIAKRPPPATIPLEKIKKCVNLKSGISIIPKRPEKCDNIGALDLSRTGKSPEGSQRSSPNIGNNSGLTITSNRQLTSLARTNEKTNMGLSNLQMLSKVATEHSSLNNKPPQMMSLSLTKPRPQIPNLQTLKMSSPQNSTNIKSSNLQKLPKLNEIPMKFRPTNAQIRNLRPNQNQNIRNIPNPSLLNQNRNSLISAQNNNSVENVSKPTVSVSSNANTTSGSTTPKEPATIISAVKNILESKVQEKAEISV